MRRLLPDPSDDVDLRAAYAVPVGASRHLRVNFVASADGGVSVDGRSGGLSSPADRLVFQTLRSLCDVVLVGAGTVRTENYGGARDVDGHTPVIAIVSATASLDPGARVFTETTRRPIVITTSAASSRSLSDVADVVIAGESAVDLGVAVDELTSRGLGRVLCEGGPRLFASLAAAGVVDELCLTVAPLLVGDGGVGRIVRGDTLSPPVSLALQHVLEDDGQLFLRYSTTVR